MQHAFCIDAMQEDEQVSFGIMQTAATMHATRAASIAVAPTKSDNKKIVSNMEMSALTSIPIDWKLGR